MAWLSKLVAVMSTVSEEFIQIAEHFDDGNRVKMDIRGNCVDQMCHPILKLFFRTHFSGIPTPKGESA